MRCRFNELRCKEVINICDGQRLGFIYDAVVNQVTGQMLAIIVPGPCRYFGLFGREDDYVIPWECIHRIGYDIILIEVSGEHKREKRFKKRFFW